MNIIFKFLKRKPGWLSAIDRLTTDKRQRELVVEAFVKNEIREITADDGKKYLLIPETADLSRVRRKDGKPLDIDLRIAR